MAERGRFVRVALAAVRLGALYGAAVATLFLLVILPVLGFRNASEIGDVVLFGSAQFLAVFAFAFLVLGITRHFGFMLLWTLLLVGWIASARGTVGSPAVFTTFLMWSLFAAPLYAMITMGIPDDAASRAATRLWRVVPIVWLLLGGVAYAMMFPRWSGRWPQRAPLAEVVLWLWTVAPFVIGGAALWRLRPLFQRERQADA